MKKAESVKKSPQLKAKGHAGVISDDQKLGGSPTIQHRVNRLQLHPMLSKVEINYDPTEPLSAAEWPHLLPT